MLPIGHSVRIGLATKQHSKTDKKLSDMCYRTMGYDFDSAINQPEKIITKELQNYSSSNSSKLDKYQQIFKTETARATGNHLKASVKVLLAEQKHQSFLQVLHDNQVTLAGRKSFFTINIRTQPSSLQINCSNCYSRNPKIKKNDRENYRWCRWNQKYTSRGRSSNNGKSNDFAGKSLLAGIPTCHIQTNITNATGIDKNNFRHQENLYNVCMERSFAYLTLCISNIARSVVPVTMSAAILSSLSTTLGAGYQYMAQHYKQYSQSFSFYAASSVILMLCYLTTPSAAAATQSETVAIDKHPIIDWSKFDESSSDKEILDLLLEKKRYDKRLLPPVNGTLTVNVNVLLLSLASPDESSLKYEVEFLLNQQWNDPRLQYGNKSHYDFLNALHHHDSIWTPDTYFIMHGDFKDPIIPMHFALRIFRNGTITYAMRRHLILSCQGSLHIFPFDDPKCSFSMESISYEEAQIKYVWKNDEDTLRKSPSLTTLNAYLIKNQTTACDQNSWRGNYSCLRVDLIFTRDRAFYFTTVFIPGIILVTSSFITFWLEWNAVPARSMIGNYSCLQVEMTFTRDRAYYFTTVFIPGIILVTSSFITFWLEWNAVPARVMIGVTTMLNFFTTSNGFRSTLPVVSNLTAMNVWDGVCMCFIYASLLEFVCVNYVGRKRPLHNVVYRPGENPVTQRLPAVLSRIGVILASPLASAIGTSEMINAPLPMNVAASKFIAGTGLRETETEFLSGMRWQDAHGGIIGAAVQNLRARSIKHKSGHQITTAASSKLAATLSSVSTLSTENVYHEPETDKNRTNVIVTSIKLEDIQEKELSPMLRRSIATSTPALVVRIDQEKLEDNEEKLVEQPVDNRRQLNMPLKPPRKKSSRSNSPNSIYVTDMESDMNNRIKTAAAKAEAPVENPGEKRRDAGAPNEIVACTTCGSSNSPCTHSVNNGCATETCFVQMRKKEPPHPIRVAKTIDVIARITFPTAYATFLIFFFVHYKGFS
ncbi:uncharacterized protein LOC6583656 isoform X5 [Drosophila mojavensis]|uniref:uncharacterized protein LOC6583656 isoform X5 n=1 Tax=Drosophila mojavensis TaxID=7230 RepID=UPI0013EE8678|nr:uncharacterized protein LOC6583656 isoform X5 [Drosophila mojavensis]